MFRINEVGPSAVRDDSTRYTIKNELLNVGKTLVLLDKGQPIYEIKHKLGHLYQQ